VNHQFSAMCQLLSRLIPATKVSLIYIQGSPEPVVEFLNYDPNTCIATFLQADGGLIVVDCNRLDAIKYDF
jgi:hypothetical protein